MSYQVLARKWRPRRFADMVGQSHVLQALTNALDRERLHHAYLFTGTRGVGKTTVARVFAKALNCETNGVSSEPCGECAACREIDEGRFVDLIEVDAASKTKVDDTRELLDNVAYMPVKGRYKIYLIDEVHMFSQASFNALLKTLEEPPEYVKFLLATTDPQKLPVTVVSRCLQFNLRALPESQIVQYLEQITARESIQADAEALEQIAVSANGSMRDALSLLDQAIGFCGDQLKPESVSDMLGVTDRRLLRAVLAALAQGDASEVFALIDQALARAVDPARLLAELTEAVHRQSMAQWLPDTQEPQLAVDPQTLQLWYQIGLTGRRDIGWAPSPRIGLEMTLLRMLAFKPGSAGAVPAPSGSTSQQPTSSPASHQPTAESAQPVPSVSAPVADQHQPLSEQPPAPQADQQPAAVAQAQPRGLEISSESWPQVVARLRMPARMLAEHCTIDVEQQRLVLKIDANFVSLATDKHKTRLREQLAGLGNTRQIEFVVNESGFSGEHPAAMATEKPGFGAEPITAAAPSQTAGHYQSVSPAETTAVAKNEPVAPPQPADDEPPPWVTESIDQPQFEQPPVNPPPVDEPTQAVGQPAKTARRDEKPEAALTPAELRERREREALANAREQIQQHPVAQVFQRQAGAVLLPESVRINT